MKRIGLGILAVAVVTLAAGSLASASSAHDQVGGTPAGSPTPIACGKAASNGGWGSATASNVRVQLHEIQPVTMPESTPVAMPQTALRVTIENLGNAPLPYQLTDFQLLDCAGHWHAATATGPAPAIRQGTLAPGAKITGWIGFDVPGTAPLAVFVYHIEATGQSGAQVRFPLAKLPPGTLTNLHPPAIGTPTAAGCTPGSAGNAVGGSAVGGSGGNGGNATGGSAQGGNATGGNGNDGADAIGGSVVGCPSTPTP